MRRKNSDVYATLAICLLAIAPPAVAQLSTQGLIHPPTVQISPPQPAGAAQPAPAHGAPLPPISSAASPMGPMPGNIFAWSQEILSHKVKTTDQTNEFAFYFTNISPAEVTISLVNASCQCTTVRIPPMPWRIPPGGSGEIPGYQKLPGVPGAFSKTITVFTDKGTKALWINTVIEAPPPGPMSDEERKRNIERAKENARAIFGKDCVSCHVTPAIGKTGKELYTVACGICHEAEHRASVVPDLHAPKVDTNAEYYRNIIANGRPGTLMPGFAGGSGGPLSDQQIASLVEYLVKTMPSKAVSTNAPPHQAGK